jgi:alpha-acetolactate decarboxylase
VRGQALIPKTATVERDRTIEVARITWAIQTAQKPKEKSTAKAAVDEALARPARSEESVATAKVTGIANRNRNVAVIAATSPAHSMKPVLKTVLIWEAALWLEHIGSCRQV